MREPVNGRVGESTTNQPWLRNVTYGIGDTRNWIRRVIARMTPSGGRSATITTDANLQTGPAPFRVLRTFADTSHGKVNNHVASFPEDGNFAYIPHQPIRRDAGTARPLRTFDDGAAVPAIYAGNPIQGM